MAATVKSILLKLNKGKREEDKIRLASDQPKDYFVKKTTSTSSPVIDAITGGGFTKGGYNTIIADGGTAKSSLACLAIKEEYEETGRIGVFLDGEGTLNESYMQRMGVEKHMIVHIKGRNLEDMLDTAEAFSTADDVGSIVIDSIPIFVSSVVEAKGAGDNNMAVEARKYTARMPIIEGNCMRRDIMLLGLTSYKKDPGAMGDSRYLSRGNWQITMANLRLNLTKKDLIKDSEGNEIGHVLDCRVQKSKLVPYDKSKVYKVNFYYDYGFNKYDEYTTLFINEGIIRQGGAWFKFGDVNAEEVSLQGKDSVITYLKENEETFNSLMEIYNG